MASMSTGVYFPVYLSHVRTKIVSYFKNKRTVCHARVFSKYYELSICSKPCVIALLLEV